MVVWIGKAMALTMLPPSSRASASRTLTGAMVRGETSPSSPRDWKYRRIAPPITVTNTSFSVLWGTAARIAFSSGAGGM